MCVWKHADAPGYSAFLLTAFPYFPLTVFLPEQFFQHVSGAQDRRYFP